MLRECCGGRLGDLAAGHERARRARADRAALPGALPQRLRRDRRRAPPHQPVRQHGSTCATATGSTRRSCRGTSSRSCPRSQEVEHAGAASFSASEPRRACSSPRRRRPGASFALRGPFGPGVAVYSALIDTRGTPRLYASSCNPFFGMKVLRSTDLGQDVQGDRSRPPPSRRTTGARSPTSGRSSRATARRSCGAASSRPRCSAAATAAIPGRWCRASATTSTPASGSPGNGGLCMHTILRDGNRVHLGISTGGHYLSEDGGETFKASNNGVGAGFTPDPYPEFGQCVHKIAGHKDAPGRLYMQNHGGWAEWDGPGRAAAGHRRAAQRRPRPHLALDRQGAAVRLRLPDRRAPARPRHGLRRAARAR